MTENAVAVREQGGQVAIPQYSPQDLVERAELVVQAGLAPEGMTPEKLAAVMLKGQEVGMQPMEAMNSLYVVNGRVAEWTHLLVAQLRKAGHDYRIIESTEKQCTVEFYRKGSEEPVEYTLTMQEVQEAGWNRDSKGEKYTWSHMPRIMLRYRTLSTGIKAHFPEVQHESLGLDAVTDEVPEPEFDAFLRAEIEARGVEDVIEQARAIHEEMLKETRIKWTADRVEAFKGWLEGAALTKQQALKYAARHYGLEDVPEQFAEFYQPDTVEELQQAIASEMKRDMEQDNIVDGEVRELDDESGQEELEF